MARKRKSDTPPVQPESSKQSSQIVKLSDVVVHRQEQERNPESAGFERYVMVDHLDADRLKIARWGLITDGDLPPTFYKVFRAGQVLYPTRNPHLRRTAYADFDGICGEKTLTLESNGEIESRLLPFIFQSERFIEYATSMAIGSTNPHVRWRDIAAYEFPLPPKDEQRRIAEILWAAHEAVEAFVAVSEMLSEVSSQLLTTFTTVGCGKPDTKATPSGIIAKHWSIQTVEDVTTICQYGLSIPLNATGAFPILRMMNYNDGEIVANELKYVDLDDDDFREFRVERDDILFNRTNSADLVGKVGIFRLDGDYVFASYLVRLRADRKKVLPEYLNAYLNSKLGHRRLLAYATPGVSQTNISAGNLKKVLVPIPPLREQSRIVAALECLRSQRRAVEQHLLTLQLQKSLLSRMLLGTGGSA